MKRPKFGSMLLLLLLLHVQLPEQILVMLHTHEHTEDRHDSGLWIDRPHEHCPSGFQFWLPGTLPAHEKEADFTLFSPKYEVEKRSQTVLPSYAQLRLRGPPERECI